jgi:hypothetical protein
VDLDQLARAGLAMQLIDVLGDHGLEQARGLHRGERAVGGIGLLVRERVEALRIEAPEALGVAPEGIDVGYLHRVYALPQAGPRRAKVGDPRGHRDARTGERDDAIGGGDQARQLAGRGSRSCARAHASGAPETRDAFAQEGVDALLGVGAGERLREGLLL